jgi:alkylated DNA repair dioxygenase AlkB
LLPCDGETVYLGPVLTRAEADRSFAILRDTIAWSRDEIVLFGKRIVTAREVAWYGDPGCSYTYSGTTKEPLPWTPELNPLKALVEDRSGASFNSCLLNLYHHGGEGMAWHSDDEKEIIRHSAIASLSLGAERRFRFKHKRQPELTAEVVLEHGSLLIMSGATQVNWQHCLPKTKRVAEPRINLTFRRIASGAA